ncbi:ABC transporter substrate-binding protein [Arthrobacter mobilis]|uniref:ABC transporter substrate-binding protein n=1 Tax=Arthrobacter mobilis TaxID=2724944 RepID=A0A7X6K576_9MICC|nr:ABC transporter substrate-binding protein [Arthrobacter mobilis]NKX53123.1 ABC transporter substrate-binding protein [Arthrobacter mobilis]
MKFRKASAITAAALVAVGFSACGSAAQSGEGTIKIGSVSSITGPVPFPEVPAAAKAVFDRVNAEGGIDGRQIEYILEDDKGDPGAASQAARLLVDEKGIVASAGSASMVECSANAAYYAQNDVSVVAGTGVDPACFKSASISPVNTGPFEGYTSLLYFASEELKHEKICSIILGLPGLTESYRESIERWSRMTGKQPALVDTSVTFGADPTPAILAAKEARCDAVVFNSTEPTAISFMKSVKQQGLLESMDWLTITAAYTDSAIKALQNQDTLGLYVNSEFTPYTSDAKELEDWRKTLTEADVPLTSLSMGGYLSATILVDVLKGIDGEITRESVSEALRALESYETPLMGTPYSFGTESAHNSNQASKMVQATDEGWKAASDDWIRLP